MHSKFSDKEILDAIKVGDDNTVLSFLYREALPLVINHVLRSSGNRAEAEDIFQDAVVVFYKKAKKNELYENTNVKGFVFQVAKNLWINYIKRKKKILFTPDYSDEIQPEIVKDIQENLITQERQEAVKKCFSELGEECQQLLQYSIYDNLSMKEICSRMGYSNENVAKTYNYRCKQKLLQILKKYKSVYNFVK